MPSLTLTLGEYAASTSAAQIPHDIRERAKQVILDEMASAYFGRRSLAGDLAAKYAMQCGGEGECRILGTPMRAPAPYAALANGAAGHGEEVDGAHVVGGHPGASIVQAAVAMAERQRVSGEELLNAVVLGYDTGIRLVEACGGVYTVKDRFCLHSDFLYAVGAAVAAARILRLDPLQHCHAMALSTFGSNALGALFSERRHISKSLCNGQFAFAGVSAALMCLAGLEGHDDIIGAPCGILDAWGVEDHRTTAVDGLGREFKIAGANFKFLNCGYPIHAAVEAALQLVADHRIGIDTIDLVEVGMPTHSLRVVDNREMHNICLQDMLAAALLLDGLTLFASPFPAILADPAFARTRSRIRLVPNAALDRDQPYGRGAIVSITAAQTGTVTQRINHPRGHSLRGGITWPELAEKWGDGLPGCDIGRMIEAARRLDELEDIRDLLETFDHLSAMA